MAVRDAGKLGEQQQRQERAGLGYIRAIADHAFSRAASAPLVGGNQVRLLKDAQENYPAWRDAIRAAKHHVHFENYIIYDDEIGRSLAHELIAKAREGIHVRLIYDWLGCFGKASSNFWNHLRAGGVEVRCYNPPHLDSPFGWLSRDHRKTIAIDSNIGFISGLCVGSRWLGNPKKNIQPWRDTGVEVRGNVVAQLERAFAHIWEMLGEPIPASEQLCSSNQADAGQMNLRIVAGLPEMAGMLRLDLLISSMARKRLWLTDAYFAGTSTYVEALKSAARDGVDVRLLLPSGTDIPILKPLSRAGYRPLLVAGVRIFEWNGTMLHAKTSVADGNWARVGSTNLNLASWFGNCELDAVIEDAAFASEMEAMYLDDLANATEVVLNNANKVRAPGAPRHAPRGLNSGGGSIGRAAAGTLRLSNTIGAAFTNHRVLETAEGKIVSIAGAALLCLAIFFVFFPRFLAYPVSLVCAWIALTLLYRGYRLHRERRRSLASDRKAEEPQ
ncbi:MAG TPA: phospholipase D-like domain-containing protein [Acidisarcina sp.]|nr:phospholipase D-like domain-containing protein [Acidisarcina sp.]